MITPKYSRIGDKSQVVKMIDEGKTSQEICEFLNINYARYNYILRKYRIKNKNRIRKYDIHADFFENIDTPEKAYILGFIYADGCIWKNDLKFGISEKDSDILKKVANAIYSSSKYNLKLNNQRVWTLTITCKKLTDDLRSIGLCENKTSVIRVPFDKIQLEFMWDFIRGYFDGDGSIWYETSKTGNKNWRASMVCKNGGFLDDVSLLFKKEGIYHEMNLATHSNVWVIKIRRKQDLFRFLSLIYSNASMYLDRKFNKYREFITTKYHEKSSGSSDHSRVLV